MLRLQISEISRQGLLGEFKEAEVVLKVGILVTLTNELQKDLDGELWGQVASVYLPVHGVPAARVQVVQLLFNLGDGSGSSAPRLRKEASHDLLSKKLEEWFSLLPLCFTKRLRVR